MLDLKFVVNNPDIVIADLKKRGQEEKITIVKELQGLYSQWLKLKQEQDRLRNRRNIISEEINKLQTKLNQSSSLYQNSFSVHLISIYSLFLNLPILTIKYKRNFITMLQLHSLNNNTRNSNLHLTITREKNLNHRFILYNFPTLPIKYKRNILTML